MNIVIHLLYISILGFIYAINSLNNMAKIQYT